MTSVVFVTYDIRGVIKIPTSQSKIWRPYWLPWQWNEFFLHFGWYFAFFEKLLGYFFAFWISILLRIIRTIRTTLALSSTDFVLTSRDPLPTWRHQNGHVHKKRQIASAVRSASTVMVDTVHVSSFRDRPDTYHILIFLHSFPEIIFSPCSCLCCLLVWATWLGQRDSCAVLSGWNYAWQRKWYAGRPNAAADPHCSETCWLSPDKAMFTIHCSGAVNLLCCYVW